MVWADVCASADHLPIATAFASTDELILDAELRSLPRPSRLNDPVALKGKAGKALASLGIETVGDLLAHLPREHAERAGKKVADLRPGDRAAVAVTVRSVTTRPMRNRRGRRVEAKVADETGPMLAVWFNQPWVARRLGEGAGVLLYGKRQDRNQFWVEEFEPLNGAQVEERRPSAGRPSTADSARSPAPGTGKVPLYPATEGISAAQLRQLVWEHYDRLTDVVEPLPAALRTAERLPERAAALAGVHFPDDEDEATAGRERLALEELLLLQLAVAGRRRRRHETRRAAVLEPTGELVDPWTERLPFELTGDQALAREQIDRDLAGERPMQRLLMGEVGSGKTVVALGAMLRAAEGGRQAALMAPTETLAEQHLLTLDRLLGGAVPVELLTGSTSAARRRDLTDRLASGELGLVVGTHALIEEPVRFASLGLVVVDEQHRFGVRQRAALDAKAPEGLVPHALHMTATPIPRTLSLTAYGDLEATVLRELPAGRHPVETHVVDGERARKRAYERIREEIAVGRQCFVVCPLVEESEALQARAATAEFERLRTTEFAEQRVELIHGQMPSAAKAAAMQSFAAGEANVLVATSVIEVGIDVPNATVMLIEAAERYGLSQLHQLRGRVGRGGYESMCVLFGDPKLPRLKAMATERDGFKLAEIDLELRGAGDVLGTRQHGLPELKVASLPEDAPLLERATEWARRLESEGDDLLRAAVAERFGSELDPIAA